MQHKVAPKLLQFYQIFITFFITSNFSKKTCSAPMKFDRNLYTDFRSFPRTGLKYSNRIMCMYAVEAVLQRVRLKFSFSDNH